MGPRLQADVHVGPGPDLLAVLRIGGVAGEGPARRRGRRHLRVDEEGRDPLRVLPRRGAPGPARYTMAETCRAVTQVQLRMDARTCGVARESLAGIRCGELCRGDRGPGILPS